MRHVVGKPVENLAHPYGDAGLGDIGAENGRAVGGGKNRLMHINADFAFFGIKGRDNLDVAGLIAPDLPMHQTDGIFWVLFRVVVDALYQGAGAVSNSSDSDLDLIHVFHCLLYVLSMNAFFCTKAPSLRTNSRT